MQNGDLNQQKYEVNLESPVSESFRCTRAANSLDINTKEKSRHHLEVVGDLNSPFKIGLIVGASGSGKTTLAKSIYGEEKFKSHLDPEEPVIDQFPKEMSYDECAKMLVSIGLTSVPCWIRPAKTLSNGQRFRAEAALAMASSDDLILIDEWTSVVDRTVAKVMSHCLRKFANKHDKQIVLMSCHYDVTEWLDPDWVIDCNEQKFIDRRLLSTDERRRKETLQFEVRECPRESWKVFSKYHYLGKNLAAGKQFFYGLYHGENQIGFSCYSNYVPKKKGKRMIMHSNRVVIHPDYAGFGLGLKMVNISAKDMVKKGYDVYAAFSSIPMLKARQKDPNWKLIRSQNRIGIYKNNAPIERNKKGMKAGAYRSNVRLFTFKYIPTK